jgi:hypothetical protein
MPASPSSALTTQRPKTPSPLPSPVVGPTTFAEQEETIEALPEVKVEDVEAVTVALEPDVVSEVQESVVAVVDTDPKPAGDDVSDTPSGEYSISL